MTSKSAEEKPPSTILLSACTSNDCRIELGFPPADLFPNRKNGLHWAATYKIKKEYREAAFWLTKQQAMNWKHSGGDVALVLIFEMPDKRHRDADNCLAAAKAGLDGMAEALGVNDRNFQPIMVFRLAGKKPGKLIVGITQSYNFVL
jgi:crossover junction endodeoxyribonuclease RusA